MPRMTWHVTSNVNIPCTILHILSCVLVLAGDWWLVGFRWSMSNFAFYNGVSSGNGIGGVVGVGVGEGSRSKVCPLQGRQVSVEESYLLGTGPEVERSSLPHTQTHTQSPSYHEAPRSTSGLLNTQIQLRFLNPADYEIVKTLCEEWFPVEYPAKWFEAITSDPNLFSLAAILEGRIIGTSKRHRTQLEGPVTSNSH